MKNYIAAGLLAAALAAPASMLAVPAMPGFRTVTQPDGTVVKLELRGDERASYWVDEEGLVAVRAADGTFCYAEPGDAAQPLRPTGVAVGSAQAEAQRSRFAAFDMTDALCRHFAAGRQVRQTVRSAVADEMVAAPTPDQLQIGSKTMQLTGSPKVLVVLVDFPDQKFASADPNAHYVEFLTKPGYDYNGSPGSMLEYFTESSHGAYTPEFTVVGPVTMANNYAYYGGNNPGKDTNLPKLIVETADGAGAQVNIKDFDMDGDDVLDALVVIYAGEGEAMSGETDRLWPVTDYLKSGSARVTHRVDGVLIDAFSITSELIYDAGKTDIAGGGIFLHEYSHLLGLPDLYTTNGVSANTPGTWSIMDTGCYSGDVPTSVPCLHSAFEAMSLGWIEPRLIDREQWVSLAPRQAVLFQMERNAEFYVMEPRIAKSWDAGFYQTAGLMVWHIDYLKTQWLYNSVNNDPDHQRVDIVEANYRTPFAPNGNLFPGRRGEYPNFTSATNPAFVSWAGWDPQLNLHNIAVDETTGMTTFWVSKTAALDGIAVDDSTDAPAVYYNLQGVRLDAPSRGQVCVKVQGGKAVKTVF